MGTVLLKDEKLTSRCRKDVRKQHPSQNDVATVCPIDFQQERVGRSESITLLLNVFLASGASVYALAFALEADISSI